MANKKQKIPVNNRCSFVKEMGTRAAVQLDDMKKPVTLAGIHPAIARNSPWTYNL